MSGVDDRVVSMKFDNALFEQKISQTIASLNKLKASLDFANSTKALGDLSSATKGFDTGHMTSSLEAVKGKLGEVNTSTKNFDMGPMGHAVDGISTKFLALSTVAVTALASITTQVLRTGAQMSSAFTIAPILGGFQEYETNMNSIQTILSNTRADGTNLEQVNAALNQLNEYSDKTIYNFSQMARNIGTFTAAGVDLDTSVGAIKGIANLAAVSGSNAEQASSAMYQLSQALATGTVRLIDWNSVVNAGMGGEVFQKALFATGQAMGTLKSTHMGQTFEEWTAAGNNFRGSLEENWLTTDVLSTTLQGFTGDMTEAQLLSIGYTQEQATEILALGADAKAAATEVKTFTQLLGTIKEAIGSGWSASFRLIIGDFEQAKGLFTEINNAIGGMVSRSAEHRNEMLTAWQAFGARDALIEGFRNAFEALGNVIQPIREAFRELFPAMTAERLIILTDRFRDFTERIRDLTHIYMPRVLTVFRGFFAVIDIVREVLRGVGSLISTAFAEFGSGRARGIWRFFTDIANAVINFRELLVTDGAIQRFFYDFQRLIQNPLHGLQRLQNRLEDIFGGVPGGEATSGAVGILSGAFQMLGDIVDRVTQRWDGFREGLNTVRDALSDVWEHISSWFGELGSRLANAFSAGDFNGAVDIINVGLLGGIILAIRRFMNGFDNLDFGSGIVTRIRDALDGVRSTLEAMQANLRAQALMRLAIAIGILTASVVVLSMINSDDLTRALTAMAVGFGQLMTAMAIMNTMGFNPARFTGMAVGMTILAVAIGILSIAVTNLSQLSWGELARGLAGITVALVALTTSTRLIAQDTSGMVRAGIAMGAMAISIGLLSIAVKSFAEMSWEEMGQGLLGVAIGLGILVVALNSMPTQQLAVSSTGILVISGALWVLAQAVEAFSEMSWEEMGQGLLGVAVALGAIVVAMRSMPTQQLAISAAGILLISAALYVMAQAVQALGDMSFSDMAQGIGGLAVMLAVLVIAVNAMAGPNTALGAASMVIVAGALLILSHVLQELSQLSWGEIARGLVAIAGVFLVIGLAALLLGPIVPIIAALGVALFLIGGAFALFGAGVWLVAKGFEALAEAGQAGVEILMQVIGVFIDALPGFVGALAASLVSMVTEFINAIPMLVDALQTLLSHLIQSGTELIPEISAFVEVLISEILRLIRQLFPQFQETGIVLIRSILTGIRDNIREFVTMGSEIFIAFMSGLTQDLPMIIASAVMMITTFMEELGNHAEELVSSGLQLLTSFLLGISNNIDTVVIAATLIITSFIDALGQSVQLLLDAGFGLLTDILQGIADNITDVGTTVTTIIAEFMLSFVNNFQLLLDIGVYVLTQILEGIGGAITDIATTVGDIILEFTTQIGNKADEVIQAGVDMLVDFLEGLARDIKDVITAGVGVIAAFITGISTAAIKLANVAADVLVDFLNGLADAIDTHAEEIREAGVNVAIAIINGLTMGLFDNATRVINAIIDIAQSAIDAGKEILHINSPSLVFYGIGQSIAEGLSMALDDDKTVERSSANFANRSVTALKNTLSLIPALANDISNSALNPVITPVLDLTKFNNDLSNMSRFSEQIQITADVSTNRAAQITGLFEEARLSEEVAPVQTGPTEVKFEQNNYSPESLSTNDIYRNTRSQIALAKEELGIS